MHASLQRKTTMNRAGASTMTPMEDGGFFQVAGLDRMSSLNHIFFQTKDYSGGKVKRIDTIQ